GAPMRELAMIGLATASLLRTPSGVRRANHFSFHPIYEVAAVFAGVFLTMLPALDLLRVRGAELGVREPWQFFWASGLLSSFLDNAPTYLAFLALGQGLRLTNEIIGVPDAVLAAISVGSVALGANPHSGTAPNLIVKAIAAACRHRI